MARCPLVRETLDGRDTEYLLCPRCGQRVRSPLEPRDVANSCRAGRLPPPVSALPMRALLDQAILRVPDDHADRIEARWDVCQVCDNRDLIDGIPAGICTHAVGCATCHRDGAWVGRIVEGACPRFPRLTRAGG